MASFLEQIGDNIGEIFSPPLPGDLGTFDQHIDFILGKVTPYGEDLREKNFWLKKRWQEVRDDEGFHESLLHLFNEGGEYLLIVDGNIVKGTWKQLNDNNSLILEMGGRSELFDLRFLNADYMILAKHGDQARKGQRKYFLLVREPLAKGRDWRTIMEGMFNIWRDSSVSLWGWVSLIIVIALMVLWLR